MPTKTPPRTVLIVDDNEDDVALFDRILTHYHFSTLRASSGHECLEIVRTRTVDLIVTEVLLPGMDGFELLRQLRYIPNAPPVIVLTAKDDLVTRVAALELGVHEFVVKPVPPSAFIARIRTVLSTR